MGLRFGKDSADQEKNLGFSRLDTCSIAINNETSALPGSGGHSEQITICSSVAAYVQAFRYFQKIHRRLNQGMVEPNFKLAGDVGGFKTPTPTPSPEAVPYL